MQAQAKALTPCEQKALEGSTCFGGAKERWSERLPLLSLALTLTLVSVALLYPSLAHPVHGIMIAVLLTLVFAISAFTAPQEESFLPGVDWMGKMLVFLPILWALCWLTGLGASPVLTDGRGYAMTAFIGAIVFLTLYYSISAWRLERFQEDGETPSPLVIAAGWLALVLSAYGAHGIYQTLGPAGAPGTFATLYQNVLESYPKDDPLRAGLLHALSEGRAFGTLGAPNIYASLMMFALPLAVAMAFAVHRTASRVVYILATVICGAALILSGSRGGILGAIAGIGAFALFAITYRMTVRARLIAMAGAAGLAVLLVAGLAAALMSVDASESRWFNASGIQQRLFYWQAALAIWSESWFSGSGPGAFETLYPQFRVPGSYETKQVHNWLLNFGLSVGAVGVAIFLAWVALVFVSFTHLQNWLAKGGQWRHATIVSGIMASAIGMLAHGMVEYTMAHREAAMFLFLALGIVAGAAHNPMMARENLECEDWSFRRAPLPLLTAIAAFAAIAFYELPGVRGEAANTRASIALMEGDAAAAMDHYSEAIGVDPNNPRYREGRALLRQQLRRPSAMVDFQEAIRLNPYSARLRERLATYHASLGQWDKAFRHQQIAIELHPLDASHHMTLAEFYLAQENVAKAREAFRQAGERVLSNDAEEQRFQEIASRLDALPEEELASAPAGG